jgi:hypothetical protein
MKDLRVIEALLRQLIGENVELRADVHDLKRALHKSLHNEETEMKGLDDLNLAETAQAQALSDLAAGQLVATTEITRLANLIAAGGDDDTSVEAAAQQILTNNATLEASATALQNAVSGDGVANGGTGATGTTSNAKKA